MQAVCREFSETSYAVLTSFLRPELASQLLAALLEADEADGEAAGAGAVDGWELRGPPHLRRFLRFTGGQGTSPHAR